MDNTLQKPIKTMILLLESTWGFSKIEDFTSESFGNRSIIFRLNSFKIRISSDRGIWFIDLSEKRKTNEWYDSQLIRELVDGSTQQDRASIEEKVDFWRKRWKEVELLFRNDAEATHRALDCLKTARAKRIFPDWFN